MQFRIVGRREDGSSVSVDVEGESATDARATAALDGIEVEKVFRVGSGGKLTEIATAPAEPLPEYKEPEPSRKKKSAKRPAEPRLAVALFGAALMLIGAGALFYSLLVMPSSPEGDMLKRADDAKFLVRFAGTAVLVVGCAVVTKARPTDEGTGKG